MNEDKNRFAGNCRTFTLSFLGFFAKYFASDFTNDDLVQIANSRTEDPDNVARLQRILRKLANCKRVFSNTAINLDERDQILDKLYKYAITLGYTQYTAYKNNQREQDVVDETNWLKRDSSFYQTLKALIDSITDDSDNEKMNCFKKLFCY